MPENRPRCTCTPGALCDFHREQGASPADAADFAERRWWENQEFH